MRFSVQEVYKGPKQATIDVWTDFSDCAANLLKGETYIVYARRDGRGRLETGACSRTQRLTDAGEDLAYVHFERRSMTFGRLYGFITSNEEDLKVPRMWWNLPNPVPGILLQLESNGAKVYAETNREGQFAFDGLARGTYTISAFDAAVFPEKEQPLATPRRIEMPASGCIAVEFYLSKSALQRR